jgi:hypothetical protein
LPHGAQSRALVAVIAAELGGGASLRRRAMAP